MLGAIAAVVLAAMVIGGGNAIINTPSNTSTSTDHPTTIEQR